MEEPTSTLQWNMSEMIRVSKRPTKVTCRCDLFIIIVIGLLSKHALPDICFT